MAPDLVPRTVLSPPEAARRRVALTVAVGSGASGLAGLWFRFDDGLGYRLVLAATSAFFGWLTMHGAFAAKDAPGAAMRALGMSIALGALSTIVPCLMMGWNDPPTAVVFYIPFGGVFGAIVGFLYGIVLAVVAAATWRSAASGTHDEGDRAVRVASVWMILPLAFMALIVFGHDRVQKQPDAQALALPIGMLAIGIAFHVALAAFLSATRRLERRRRWLALVVSGIDPRWGVREIGPHDDLGNLPRLRPGYSVLEHRNEHALYRSAATGEAVAII